MVIVGVLALILGGVLGHIYSQKHATPPPSDDLLRERFKAAASEAMQVSQAGFLAQAKLVVENAREVATSEFQKQGLTLQKNLEPLRASLEKLESNISSLERARVGAYAGLTQQLENLSLAQKDLRLETSALVQALRDPKTRGSWGELQLKRAVEFAGMSAYVDFQTQVSVSNSDERSLQPDMVIRLPAGRHVVVDAKTPMRAYLEALNATTPDEKKRLFCDHARQLRDHFKKLGQKQYWAQFSPSPEFVVLFLPQESLLSAALEFEPQLIEDAVREHVIIATPTTLIALLKTVAYGWGEFQAAERARHVVSLGNELIDRFSTVLGYWKGVGVELKQAVEKYNQAVASTEARLMPTARALAGEKKLEEPEGVQVLPREMAVAETQTRED